MAPESAGAVHGDSQPVAVHTATEGSLIDLLRAIGGELEDEGLRVAASPKGLGGAVRYESGITREIAPSSSVQVLKPETVRTVSSMLTEVFDKALVKGKFKMEHYSIAAKTGTAQIAIPGQGYYEDRYLHSFFGYFPAQDPKLIVFLFTVEPHGAEFASATLAQPFDDLAKFLINYYDIPPDR